MQSSRTVAGDVACFDDACSFSVLFRPCVSCLLAGQKRGHMTVAVVVCFVENCCSLGRPRCAARGRPCRGGEVDAVQLVAAFCVRFILAQSLAGVASLYSSVLDFFIDSTLMFRVLSRHERS